MPHPQFRASDSSVEVPKGTYWVGDPCYAFSSEWDGLLFGAKSEGEVTYATFEDVWFVASHTMFGDGGYEDQEGRYYPVDAGMIGVTPVRAVGTCPSGMHTVTFDADFTVSYRAGTITIGNLSIPTNWDDLLDDEDSEGEDEDGEEF